VNSSTRRKGFQTFTSVFLPHSHPSIESPTRPNRILNICTPCTSPLRSHCCSFEEPTVTYALRICPGAKPASRLPKAASTQQQPKSPSRNAVHHAPSFSARLRAWCPAHALRLHHKHNALAASLAPSVNQLTRQHLQHMPSTAMPHHNKPHTTSPNRQTIIPSPLARQSDRARSTQSSTPQKTSTNTTPPHNHKSATPTTTTLHLKKTSPLRHRLRLRLRLQHLHPLHPAPPPHNHRTLNTQAPAPPPPNPPPRPPARRLLRPPRSSSRHPHPLDAPHRPRPQNPALNLNHNPNRHRKPSRKRPNTPPPPPKPPPLPMRMG